VRAEELGSVAQTASGSSDWQLKTTAGVVTLRPFTAIEDEHYRLYLDLESQAAADRHS